MSLVSTYPAAKAAILSLLTNSASLDGVPVFYGLPASISSRDYVTLGDMSGTQTAVVIANGRLPRDEEYDLDITFVSARSPGAQQEATERVFELAGVLEQELRSAPSLDGLVTWALVTQMSLDEAKAEDSGSSARLVVSVSIRARVEGA